MNGLSRLMHRDLMGNTGTDVSIIVGCGSKRRGWGAINQKAEGTVMVIGTRSRQA